MSRARRSASLWVLALVLSLLVSLGCKHSESGSHAGERRLVVFAAASLREAFTALGDTFRRAHPDVEVRFNFAGTQELRTQLEHGARADVFASADQRHMVALSQSSRVTEPVVFARNEPVIVVARERASDVRSIADLPSLRRIVIGAPDVPIGRYTQQVLDRASNRFSANFRARVEEKVVSRELNVKQVLAKVRLGEAEAGIVYRSDVGSARGAVSLVSIPSELNVTAEYPIAVVDDAIHPALARAWVDLVLSEPGQRALRDAGFSSPSR